MRPLAIMALSALLLGGCEAAQDDPGEGTAAARSAYEPTEAERAEILRAVQTVFDALRGEAELLEGVMLPDVVMHSTEVRPDGSVLASTSTLPELTARISSSESVMTERMWDPEVRVSGPIATVWTPYDFYVGETFSHCGIDVATLVRTPAGWRIASLDWTRQQPPACALHPDGPPER